MKKEVLVYPIKSILHKQEVVDKSSKELLDYLEEKVNVSFKLIDDPKELKKDSLILVQSGGSENKFLKEIYPYFEGPYYLLTYGANNSLAASLEILSFLNNNSKQAEVLHGSFEYVAKRLDEILNKKDEKLVKLGVLGTPSDWLISSNVDYQKAKDVFGVELVDYKTEDIVKYVRSYINNEYKFKLSDLFDKDTQIKSYAIYESLKALAKKDNLYGLTIRCFDIIMATHQSACFALAKLNQDNIIATCEGDIPAMLSMYVVLNKLGLPSFQVNPQFIDTDKDIVEFAHCTLPLQMCKDYELMTHYESGEGMAIKADMEEGDVTVFKIGASLKEFYVEEGKLEHLPFSPLRCRTQVKVTFNSSVKYFLKNSLGNHHLIVYGKHKDELIKYLTDLGLKQVL